MLTKYRTVRRYSTSNPCRFPAQFTIFNAKFLVFDTQFLDFNAQFIIVSHLMSNAKPPYAAINL